MEITPQDRGLKYALFNAVILSINNENYLQVTLQPITDRKQAEKALRDSEEKFRVCVFRLMSPPNSAAIRHPNPEEVAT